MIFYAIQVRTRSEEKFIKLFTARFPDVPFRIHFPKRRLFIRRGGKLKPSSLAIFPGYIFIEAAGSEEVFSRQWDFRRTEWFYRFLKSNREITPLANKDLETVAHFIHKAGPVAGISRVYFNENDRITVLEGPLMGLEGKIVKVDKRKCRAKIKLDLYEDSFTLDLAFEVIKSS